MFRKIFMAAALVTSFSGFAMAQQPITILGQGENFAVDYSNDGGNILGGGHVRVSGHGENASYHYEANAPAQRGWMPHVISQGESGRVIYTPSQDANPSPLGTATAG